MVAAQVAGLYILNPVAYELAWARYIFPVWPAILLLCGIGVGSIHTVALRLLTNIRFVILLLVILAFLFVLSVTIYPQLLRWIIFYKEWLFWIIVSVLIPIVFRGVLYFVLKLRSATVSNGSIVSITTGFTGCAWALGCVLLSPFNIYDLNVNSFRGHPSSLAPVRYNVKKLPKAYELILKDSKAENVVLEYSNCRTGRSWPLLFSYQRFHGKEVKMMAIQPLKDTKQVMKYRNVVNIHSQEELARSGAKYLVVHNDIDSEMKGVILLPNNRPPVKKIRPAILKLIEKKFGKAVYKDNTHNVFTLKTM